MKTIAAIVCYLLIFFSQTDAVAEEAIFTEAVMRSTFKIAGPGSEGTAFLLGKPDPKAKDKLFFVLITAAHVLEGIKGEFATLFLRTHESDGYKKFAYQVPIRSGTQQLWKQHPEVDVAVMLLPIPRKADIYLASTDLLATENELTKLDIHAGEEVFVLGYPYGAQANEAGFPILRSGRVSSFPLTPTAMVKTFLLDFPVFRGNSGGPVFIDQRIRGIGRKTAIGNFASVLGIVSQELSIKEEVKSLQETQIKSHKLGIAVIVHAAFIADLVNSLLPAE